MDRLTDVAAGGRLQVAVVGAGCSGTLAAAELLRQAAGPLEVSLIDAAPTGRGVAYGTTDQGHLLNVPAERMSGRVDEPDHFVRWLAGRGVAMPAGMPFFAPRPLYGEYLADLLHESEAAAARGVRLIRHRTEVVEILVADGMARLILDAPDPGVVTAGAVVLALGNRPGPGPLGHLLAPPHYYRDPWSPDALRDLDPDRPVLIIGTGLTMIDVAITLSASGHRSGIDAISPRGHLPQAHAVPTGGGPAPAATIVNPTAGAVDLRHLFRVVRTAGGRGDWRATIDSLRPVTAALWSRLTDEQKRRFVRHGRHLWDIHRHRMAPEIGHRIEQLQRAGFLRVHAARLVSAAAAGDGVRVSLAGRAGPAWDLDVQRVLNATGPELDVRRMKRPPVPQLLGAGLARPHATGLGLDARPDGRLIDGAGRPSATFHTLGPPLKGVLWETTAVPEIRVQARELAARLLRAAAARE